MKSTLSLLGFASLASAAQLPFLPSTFNGHSIISTIQPSLSESSNQVHQLFTHSALPAHTLRVTQPPQDICERSNGKKSWSGYLDVDVDKLREHNLKHQPDGQSILHSMGEVEPEFKDQGVIEHFYFWAFGESEQEGAEEEGRGNPEDSSKPCDLLHLVNFSESRNDATKDPVGLWLNGGPGCSSFTGLLMENGPCNATPGNKTEMNPWSWNSNATMVYFDQVSPLERVTRIENHVTYYTYRP